MVTCLYIDLRLVIPSQTVACLCDIGSAVMSAMILLYISCSKVASPKKSIYNYIYKIMCMLPMAKIISDCIYA